MFRVPYSVGILTLVLAVGSILGQSSTSTPSTHQRAAAAHAQTKLAERSPLQDELNAAIARRQSASTPLEMIETTQPYLAQLLLRLSQATLLEGDAARASEVAAQAVEVDGSGDLRLAAASMLLRLNRPAKAAEVLAPAMQNDLSQNVEAWSLLGAVQRDSGHEADAVSSFARALKLNPDINVAYALGSVLLSQHRQTEAERLFRDIFTASNNAALWHVAVGDAYREARYYPQAVAEFGKAIALDAKALHAEFFLGLTYLQMNEWGPNSESFMHLRKAVEISPHEYLSNFYLGALEATDGTDLASSNSHLRVAAEADPTQPEVWIYLGQNANREHHIDEAEKDFRKAIDLTGADEQRNNYQIRRAYFSLGRLLVASGRRDEGLKLLEKYKAAQQAAVAASGNKIGTMAAGEDAPAALDTTSAHKAASDPVTAEHFQTNLTDAQQTTLKSEKATLLQMLADGFNDLGTAEARLQQYDSALKYFLEAEKWEPPNRVLLRNIGAAAFRAGDFAEAARALSVYAKTGERDDRAKLMLAFSQFNQGRFADAAAAFGASSAAAMADDRAAYSYAFSLARSGHAQEANAIANELTTRTLPAEILSLVCHIYVDSENYQGSLDCYRKAYVQDPSLKLAHYEAGQALVHLDRPQEAIAELEAELKLQPDDPNIQYSLGYALLQASRKEEAQQKFEQVIAGHPDQGPAQYQLGKLLLDSGKVNDAIMHLEASEKSDSGPDYTHYQLGVAYRKAGRTTDAEREFKLYREIKDRKRDASAVPAAAAKQ